VVPLGNCYTHCTTASKFLYLIQMMHLFKTYMVRPSGLLVISLFSLSLVWCPDAACRTESGDDQCSSLICALFAKPDSANQAQSSDLSTACVCVCHTQTVPGPTSDREHSLTGQNILLESSVSFPATTAKSIYRPPKA